MKQYLGFFIQRHMNSRAAQEEKSFKVVRLNPLWTNNVCTNLLAVQPVVETRLKRTDWLLCFTLKNSVWLFLRCLEGALHHKQPFPKKTSGVKTRLPLSAVQHAAFGIITNIFINQSQLLVCCFSNTPDLFAALSESRNNCCATRPGLLHNRDARLDHNGGLEGEEREAPISPPDTVPDFCIFPHKFAFNQIAKRQMEVKGKSEGSQGPSGFMRAHGCAQTRLNSSTIPSRNSSWGPK